MKISLLGIGQWGQKLASFLVTKKMLSSVVSTGDPHNLEKIRVISKNIKIQSFEELITDDSIDAVVIATPISTLFSLAKQTLEAGKHVFLEKPGAMSPENLLSLQEICKRKKTSCYVNYLYTADPVLSGLRSSIEKDPIESIEFRWRKWGSFDSDILLNLVSHDVAMFLFLGVSAARIVNKEISENTAKIEFCTLSGTKVTINIDRCSHTKEKTMIIKTKRNTYKWQPGILSTNEKTTAINNVNLLECQFDTFFKVVDSLDCHENLSMSTEVLKKIEEIREA